MPKYRIEFLPVRNGDVVEMTTGTAGGNQYSPHHILGFRPLNGRSVAGHLVVAVALTDRGSAQHGKPVKVKKARALTEKLASQTGATQK